MLRRLSFWTAAVLFSAGVAYVVAVPGALDPPVATEEAAQESDNAADPVETAAVDAVVDAVEPGAARPREPAPRFRPAPGAQSPLDPDTVSPGSPGVAGLQHAPALPRLPMQPTAPRQPAEPAQAAPAALGEISVERLPFNAECGLLLRPAGEREVIFASGISLDPAGGPAAIIVDGDLVRLSRVGFEGEPLGYNQFPRQLFRDDAESVAVVVEIALEDELLDDVARVSEGTLTVMKAEGPPTQLAVAGRAGC